MSGGILFKGTISFNGTDYTALVKSVRSDIGLNLLDNTTVPDNTQISTAGLRTASISVDGLISASSATSIDTILWNAMQSGTPVTVAWTFGAGVVSASNPKYSGSFVVSKFNTSATVGELLTFTVDLEPAGDVIRAIS